LEELFIQQFEQIIVVGESMPPALAIPAAGIQL
jgi:hypothetical protein